MTTERNHERSTQEPRDKPTPAPTQPGATASAPIPKAPDPAWAPKDPKALHPDIVKKEANMALHAMRPQPRAADIDVVLLVMWTDHEHEYTEIDAIHKAAVAKFKELFPLTNPAVAAG